MRCSTARRRWASCSGRTARVTSTPERAGDIIAELPPTMTTVGVFVNEPVDGIRAVVARSGISGRPASRRRAAGVRRRARMAGASSARRWPTSTPRATRGRRRRRFCSTRSIPCDEAAPAQTVDWSEGGGARADAARRAGRRPDAGQRGGGDQRGAARSAWMCRRASKTRPA